MGKKSDAPAAPDYTPVANASKESAELSFKLGQDQLAWAKEQYALDKEVTDRVVDSFMETQDANNEAAKKDRARYEEIYQPLEDSLAKDAADYSTPERKDLEVGRAQAAVGQQFDAARGSAIRQLEAYGVNPSATRFAALDIGTRAQEAATKAAAGNQASQMVDATGRALRSEAINVGRGYPGQVATTYNTALQSGTGAVNSTLAQTASGANTMGTGAQWQGLGNNALNTWGNTLNMGFQNQLASWKANQESSSGIGALLGAGVGALTSPIPGSSLLGKLFKDGGVVDGEVDGGVDGEGGGGAVPADMSPTGGAATDDVPAALNVGEFVMPDRAVRWYGEKYFHGLIEKADRDRDETERRSGATPDVGPMPAAPPAFVSGRQPQGAI